MTFMLDVMAKRRSTTSSGGAHPWQQAASLLMGNEERWSR